MRNNTETDRSENSADIAALDEKFHDIEAQLTDLRAATTYIYRRGFSRGIVLGFVPFIAFLLLIGSMLYAQSAGDALFIDPRGNVGIGVASPAATLDVSGKANTDKQISLQLRSGNRATNFDSNQVAFGWSNTETYRHAIKSRHNGAEQKNNALDFYLWRYDKAKPDPAAIGGLLTMTLNGGNVGIGTPSPTEKLEVNGRIKDQTGYVVPVGSIVAYQGAIAPDGWLLCDGSGIPNEAKYQDLKDLLAKSITPDLRGRTLIGAGQGEGLSLRALGQQGGEENHQLTVAEMPSHNHHGFGESKNNNYWPFGKVGDNRNKGTRGGVDEDNFYYNTSNTGGNTSFNNMQPYHVANYIIKY